MALIRLARTLAVNRRFWNSRSTCFLRFLVSAVAIYFRESYTALLQAGGKVEDADYLEELGEEEEAPTEDELDAELEATAAPEKLSVEKAFRKATCLLINLLHS